MGICSPFVVKPNEGHFFHGLVVWPLVLHHWCLQCCLLNNQGLQYLRSGDEQIVIANPVSLFNQVSSFHYLLGKCWRHFLFCLRVATIHLDGLSWPTVCMDCTGTGHRQHLLARVQWDISYYWNHLCTYTVGSHTSLSVCLSVCHWTWLKIIGTFL